MENEDRAFTSVFAKWNELDQKCLEGNLPDITRVSLNKGKPSGNQSSAPSSAGGDLKKTTTKDGRSADSTAATEDDDDKQELHSNKKSRDSLKDRIKMFDQDTSAAPSWGKAAAAHKAKLEREESSRDRHQLRREVMENSDQIVPTKNQKNILGITTLNDIAEYDPPVFEKDYNEKKLIHKAIKSSFLFEDLDASELKELVQAFEKIQKHKGDKIIKQGGKGDYFYIIGKGKVIFEDNGVQVGSASTGDYFGELGLLYTSPRAVTVIADTDPTELFRVDQRTFQHILQAKTQESSQHKLELLKKAAFLQDFSEKKMRCLVDVMTPLQFNAGDVFFKKGSVVNAFYLLDEGEMIATDISIGCTPFDDIPIHPGMHFGERAIIANKPVPGNIVAITSGTVFAIDRATFEKILGSFSKVVLGSQDKIKLKGIHVIKMAGLEESMMDALVSHIVDKTYKADEAIMEEGKKAEPALYLLREGNVVISTKDGSRSETIEAGAYFGDEQLTAKAEGLVDSSGYVSAEYTATVSPGESCVCGILSLKECDLILDSSKTFTPRKPKQGQKQHQEIRPSEDKSDPLLSQIDSAILKRRSKMKESIQKIGLDLRTLDRDTVLGEGQFGEVWLVKADVWGKGKDDAKEEFALKIQSKLGPDCVDYTDVIRREIEVVQQLEHPFIIDLLDAYESEEQSFILMDLIKGGELWDCVHKEDDDGNWTNGVSEEHAKFYALIVADALAYMHRQQVIFRDLKPENIMIDSDGYPIVIDFGFAKVCEDKAYTFCGTPNYVSPEIISNRGHGVGVDHWALGVVIYEMIAGENPFFYEGMNPITLYEVISTEEPFPFGEQVVVSKEAKYLVDSLLEKDPTQRLGFLAGGERDILTHKWFDGLDLYKLRSKLVPAPFIPHS